MLNRNTLALAEKIRFECEQTFLEDRKGYRLRKEMDDDFIEFCREFCTSLILTRHIRDVQSRGLKKFISFLASTPRYEKFKNSLKMKQLTPEMVGAFVGIKEKISWHCGRHSFAVNVLNKGANIKTVSNLLDHTSLKMTERYLHVVDSLKQNAIDSLGEINYCPM